MTKRNNHAAGAPRAGRFFPRLQDVRIRSKLGLILLIPLFALLGVASLRLYETAQRAAVAGDLEAIVAFGSTTTDLVHELQNERALAARLLASDELDPEEAGLDRQVKRTEKVHRSYVALREDLPRLPSHVSEVLTRVDAQLDDLDRLRDAVTDEETTLYAATLRYRTTIGDLISLRDVGAQFGGELQAVQQSQALAALSKVKEYVAQEHVVMVRVAALGRYAPALQREFVSTIAGQQEAQLDFVNSATPEQFALLQQTSIDGNAIEARRFAAILNRTSVNSKVHLVDDLDTMTNAMGMWRESLHDVEDGIDSDLAELASAYRDQQVRLGVTEGMAVLIAMVIAILVAVFIARSMATSLRRLREGALAVAYEGLPRAVARLRDGSTLVEQTPEEVARAQPDPVRVGGRDETGQVALAFNIVHREAIRVAAEQAVLRASVSTMFSNLARRSQSLVDRLIGVLDELERNEADPDRLARLFQLDHLATRMRRNDENLLVLAGADSSRGHQNEADIADVLRAAQSEVEQYTRIDFGVVDSGVLVATHAVNDVVHLLAELFDNAIAFSPPGNAVMVDARRVGDRVVVEVEDRGIGISESQLAKLNERLARPPEVDVTVSRMMGLVVVSRIAERHGISVELRNTATGTIADVILPTGTLAMGSRFGRQGDGTMLRAVEPPALPAVTMGGQRATGSGLTPGMIARGAPIDTSAERMRRPTPPAPHPPAAVSPPSGGEATYQPTGRHESRHGVQASAAQSWNTTAGDSTDRRREDGGGAPDTGARPSAHMPIFDDLESVWFQPEPAAQQPTPPRPRPRPGGSVPGAAEPGGTRPAGRWQGAADGGWRAASAAAEPTPAGRTNVGLPKRAPMSQLVPGSVDSDLERPRPPLNRNPNAVKGFLAAYQNGVERGRGARPGR